MKISCHCGTLIPDATDDLPHKAHLLPDRGWCTLWDKIDALIEQQCDTPQARAQACTRLRSMLSEASRPAYQCPACGTVYLSDSTHTLHAYPPTEASAPRQLWA